jgi:hypothetical protein
VAPLAALGGSSFTILLTASSSAGARGRAISTAPTALHLWANRFARANGKNSLSAPGFVSLSVRGSIRAYGRLNSYAGLPVITGLTFPTFAGLQYPVERVLLTSTVKEESIAGQTNRTPLRARPKWQWTLDFEFLRENFQGTTGEWSHFMNFILSVLGPAQPFYYPDANDNIVSTPAQFGTGDGVTTQFQLVRYLGGFAEPVYGPIGTPIIFINGAAQSSGYAISTNGLVTFSSAPAASAVLTWTGSFNWLVEADDDKFQTQAVMNGLYVGKSFAFTSKLL